jgi:hypothetical protein
MKHLALLFLLLLISTISSAQEFFYENNFDGSNTDSLLRMGEEENNIWQIGASSKTVFSGIDSAEYLIVGGVAYDIIVPPSIMTDTANNYPTNNVSSFEIEFGHDSFGDYHDVFFAIYFSHKYQTDKGRDGGVIELSHDGGLNWENIIEPTFPAWTGGHGIYTANDTLADGTPAFTGESENWISSTFQWQWHPSTHPWAESDTIDLRIRFLFKSDSIENNMAGWIIDNIQLLYSSTESIKENELQIHSKVFPNPVYSESILRFDNSTEESLIVEIFNVHGTNLKSTITNDNQIPIYKSEFEPGIYFYRISSLDSSYYGSGKFIVN